MKDKDFLFFVLFLALALWGWILGDRFVRLLDLALFGVMCHYFNGINKGSIKCELTEYFKGAFINTLASLGGCIIGVFTIVQSNQAETLNYMVAGSAFSVGYLSNSLFNRPPPTAPPPPPARK